MENLRAALTTRGVIGEAMGMIRLIARCESEAAFDTLPRVSQSSSHLKGPAVAILIAEAGSGGAPLTADVQSILDRCLGSEISSGSFFG